ncbi:MAG: response regulator transcription factor [Thermoanaerobaculia bacterium]|nr:MAG: response regulator transcription factor [Thermoanaerobaculia bacterium]
MAETRPPDPLTVFVVDDDPAVRDSLALMLGLEGFRVSLFADAEDFLRAWREEWAGCVVADLRLPGRSGIELQAELQGRGSALPFVIVTAHGDVPTARTAFRAQAVDFLEKPFDHGQLRRAIETAFGLEERRIVREQTRGRDAAVLATLTPREREVLEHAARGLHAREIAETLGISPRTVEVHKAHIMAKLNVRNVAEMVRFALAGGSEPDSD